MTTAGEKLVVVGRVAGVYGVRGWVRVESYTSPKENLLSYRRWHLQRQEGPRPVEVLEGQPHGKGLVVRLKHLDDRDRAMALVGLEVAVPRSELPKLPKGEYYWTDLQGLRVETVDGVALGTVDHLFATGANDVLVVQGERERLVPFVQGQVVTRIDLDGGVMVVDWDPDF